MANELDRSNINPVYNRSFGRISVPLKKETDNPSTLRTISFTDLWMLK